MPYYKCVFVNDKGEYNKRIIFSDSRGDLLQSFVNSEEKLLSARRTFYRDLSSINVFKKKVSDTEFLLFNQKLITLLRAGVSFARALEIIIKNMEDGNFREILKRTESDIKNGIQISDAFSSSLLPFQKIYKASLLAGERSGQLVEILEKFNRYVEKISSMKKKLISSLSYPVILFVFMVTMVFLVLVYAIPRFTTFYRGFDADLPGFTLTLIGIANFFKDNMIFFLVGILVLYFCIKIVEKIREDVVLLDFLKLKLPFMGKIIHENALAVFSRTLSILIAGGIPVPESMGIAVETFSNKYFQMKTRHCQEKIKEGNLLSDVLEEISLIPGMMVEVVRVGESSGNLVDVLDKNADYFENSINSKVNSLISLIEPILIVVLGLVIAFMLISIYLPIFNLVNVVDRAGL